MSDTERTLLVRRRIAVGNFLKANIDIEKLVAMEAEKAIKMIKSKINSSSILDIEFRLKDAKI